MELDSDGVAQPESNTHMLFLLWLSVLLFSFLLTFSFFGCRPTIHIGGPDVLAAIYYIIILWIIDGMLFGSTQQRHSTSSWERVYLFCNFLICDAILLSAEWESFLRQCRSFSTWPWVFSLSHSVSLCASGCRWKLPAINLLSASWIQPKLRAHTQNNINNDIMFLVPSLREYCYAYMRVAQAHVFVCAGWDNIHILVKR